jgi:Flp pilus assembly protein TadD
MFSAQTTKIRFSLAAVLAATLGACEDVPPPPKPRPVISAEPPRPEPLPLPSAMTPPPVTPEPPPVKPEVATEPEADDVKPGDPLGGARKMLDAGKLDKALRLANLGVRRLPKRSVAWNTLGRVQLQMGKRSEAISSFEKAVELNPNNSYAQNNLGLALIYDKRFEDAVGVLEKAVELEPVEAYMWNNLGMAYEQLDRLEEARDAYDKGVQMESERARTSLARLEGVKTVFRTARADTPAVTKKDDAEGGAKGASDDTTAPSNPGDSKTPGDSQKDELRGQL